MNGTTGLCYQQLCGRRAYEVVAYYPPQWRGDDGTQDGVMRYVPVVSHRLPNTNGGYGCTPPGRVIRAYKACDTQRDALTVVRQKYEKAVARVRKAKAARDAKKLERATPRAEP